MNTTMCSGRNWTTEQVSQACNAPAMEIPGFSEIPSGIYSVLVHFYGAYAFVTWVIVIFCLSGFFNFAKWRTGKGDMAFAPYTLLPVSIHCPTHK